MSQTWNLTELYNGTTDPAIAADFEQLDLLVHTLEQYRGRIASLSATELVELITTWETFQQLSHRLDLFAGLLDTTNVGIASFTRFVKQTEEALIERTTRILFLETELAALTSEQWQQYLSAPELQNYHKFLSELAEQAQHTLSEPEEKILAQKSQTSVMALNHLYDVTTDTLAFDWDGQSITLEELMTKFHDPDAATRRQAAAALSQGLETNRKTTPAILNSLIQDKAISDQLRQYDFPEAARFQADDVERETVEAMVAAVSRRHDLVTRYYTLKKRIMGVTKLSWWDRYAPLPNLKTKIDQEQGTKMVIDAYRQFSPELTEIVQAVIDKQHVDWLPSATKRGGAFCAYGTKDIYPYVLMNYTDSPRDVMTLAHELGHAAHDVLASRNNVSFQAYPSLAVAEIASVFGETILFEKLVHSDIAQTDKIALLMSFIEDRFATVFRQTTMFQFEQQLHQRRRTEGELSKEEIDELWHTTMQLPFAEALEYTDNHKNTWMYVGHIFHTPFYVYSYAFAQLCVLALYEQYKERGEAFVPTYLTLLKTGGRLSPKDNLAQAGLDITQASFWDTGLQVIENVIDQLAELVDASQ